LCRGSRVEQHREIDAGPGVVRAHLSIRRWHSRCSAWRCCVVAETPMSSSGGAPSSAAPVLLQPRASAESAHFLLLPPAAWILGAHAVDHVAAGWATACRRRPGRLRRAADGANRLRSLADGSRPRLSQPPRRAIGGSRGNEPILSDDAETIRIIAAAPAAQLFRTHQSETLAPRSFSRDSIETMDALPRIPTSRWSCSPKTLWRRLDQFSHIFGYRSRGAGR